MKSDWPDDHLHEWAQWLDRYMRCALGYPNCTAEYSAAQAGGRGVASTIVPKNVITPGRISRVHRLVQNSDSATRVAVYYGYQHNDGVKRTRGERERMFCAFTGMSDRTYRRKIAKLKKQIRVSAYNGKKVDNPVQLRYSGFQDV